jgi:hypothetical protein
MIVRQVCTHCSGTVALGSVGAGTWWGFLPSGGGGGKKKKKKKNFKLKPFFLPQISKPTYYSVLMPPAPLF